MLPRPLRVLVACEFSGIVRDAFTRLGHEAWSCDLLPSESPGKHFQGDVLNYLHGWDLIIAHPPCTDLSVSGARWHKQKWADGRVQRALHFFVQLACAPCHHIAVENPVSIVSRYYRKPDQIIQPWQFGHGEIKATCFWLKGLPALVPTSVVTGREPRVHCAVPGPDRWKERSRTLPGVAAAMAQQWSEHINFLFLAQEQDN